MKTAQFDVNNGSALAEFICDNDLQVNGLTCDQVAELVRPYCSQRAVRFMEDDDFWGDFCDRAASLGLNIVY